MRLAFLGTPDFAVPTLAAILAAGHDVVRVYSQPPAPRGRGHMLKASPVQAFAEKAGLPVRTPTSLAGSEEVAAAAALGLDAAVVVAFGQILTGQFLAAPRLGSFNLHASLLPRWRGAAPIQRAIMAGDPETGVCVMRLTAGLDEGPVLARQVLPIGDGDTAGSVQQALAREGASLMVSTLAQLAGGSATESPQAAEGVTFARRFAPKMPASAGSRGAIDADRQIRGLSPVPSAWFMKRTGERRPVRVKALLCALEPGAARPEPSSKPICWSPAALGPCGS